MFIGFVFFFLFLLSNVFFTQESDLNNSYTSSVYKVLNIPREIYQLVDYLNRNGMKTVNLFTVERKYASNPLINDIRDWLNFWSPTDFRKLHLCALRLFDLNIRMVFSFQPEIHTLLLKPY